MSQFVITAIDKEAPTVASTGWWTLLKQYLLFPVLDLVFPPVCIGCKRVGQTLCGQCMASIRDTAPDPLSAPLPSIQDLIALGIFDGLLQQAVHALKYEGQTALAAPLGNLLAEQVTRANWTPGVIAPVPLHKSREESRGYNQAAILGAHMAKCLGWDYAANSLVRTRQTQSQVGLDRHERRENVRDAFTVASPEAFQDRDVILIDDVFTTGATLRECATAVHCNGALNVRAVVVGKAKYGSQGSSPA